MGKSSPPPAPDYAGMAKEQGQANLDAAIATGKLNNPQVISPYGTQTVQYGGGVNQAQYDKDLAAWQSLQDRAWSEGNIAQRKAAQKTPKPELKDYTLGDPAIPTVTQRFSPEQQALYNMEVGNKLSLGDLAATGIGNAQGVLGTAVDYSGAPAMPTDVNALRTQATNAMMQRPLEDYARNKEQLNSNLIAAGLRPGSKAYDDRMNLLNRQLTDAQMQAQVTGGQEASRQAALAQMLRQQYLGEYQAKRQTPLNEITALLSGSQVQNPFSMPGYAQNANMQPAPVFAAGNALGNYQSDIYNAEAAQQGGMQSGLFGLGAAGITAAAIMM